MITLRITIGVNLAMHSLNDNQLAVYEHLREILETSIQGMYPLNNKQVAKIYTEEILDYAYVPICELADDIEATEKTNPDIY
jgi:hypothetical protein